MKRNYLLGSPLFPADGIVLPNDRIPKWATLLYRFCSIFFKFFYKPDRFVVHLSKVLLSAADWFGKERCYYTVVAGLSRVSGLHSTLPPFLPPSSIQLITPLLPCLRRTTGSISWVSTSWISAAASVFGTPSGGRMHSLEQFSQMPPQTHQLFRA